MNLKGTRTEANLLAAFAGESQARNKYTYYASAARKDGYQQIADIFEKTAANEKEHAKLWFKYLHDGAVPATMENLKDAAAGERFEWTEMYKEFADVADEEGFTEIAKAMRLVADVEKELKQSSTKEEFAEPLRRSLSYYYQSKTEWEVIITPWCGGRDTKDIKIDVYWQIMNNWEIFLEYVWSAKPKRRQRSDRVSETSSQCDCSS